MLLAGCGAIAFSGKAIIVKLAYRHGVDAVTLIMYRMLFALPIFALMGWWASRGKAPLTRNDWLGILGLGFTGYYLASFLDFAGLAYISASLERLILYLNPTLVLLLGLVFIQTSDLIERRLIWRLSGKMKYAPLISALIIALFGGAMVILALLGRIGE